MTAPDFVIEVEQSDSLGSTLAMRPGEWAILWPDLRLDIEPLYCVALIEMPPVPREFELHDSCEQYAVACGGWFYANDENEKTFGWVHLEPDTKAYLGNMLMQVQAEPGRWYYLEIVQERPFPDVQRVTGAKLE